ncbi:hypothetical protein [Pseudomonas lundensis]|uniref:hypothetical protein n=1 Tax=Pseudomonas lundensis TaxID=86185 RepID=UPI000BA273D6|nr:hypothetical protein [Pseudomonas lundensis]OZY32046.1 hypothetical protein CJF36_13990 [Pseudomonas lundensis]
MALMIDAEPLLELLAAIDAANQTRYALAKAYRELTAPVTPAQTGQFHTEYQKASTEWANACGALAFTFGVEVEKARATGQ